MEIKNIKGVKYPPLIKDLVKELLKDDFVHFKILCANEVHHFNKEDDSVIEFQETYMKETSANGDMLYIPYLIFSGLNYIGILNNILKMKRN